MTPHFGGGLRNEQDQGKMSLLSVNTEPKFVATTLDADAKKG